MFENCKFGEEFILRGGNVVTFIGPCSDADNCFYFYDKNECHMILLNRYGRYYNSNIECEYDVINKIL